MPPMPTIAIPALSPCRMYHTMPQQPCSPHASPDIPLWHDLAACLMRLGSHGWPHDNNVYPLYVCLCTPRSAHIMVPSDPPPLYTPWPAFGLELDTNGSQLGM
jgi:hypothetical protein